MFVMMFAFSSAGYAQISDPVQSEVVGPVTMPVLDDATDHAIAVLERPFTVTGENAQAIGPGSGDAPALIEYDRKGLFAIASAPYEVGWRISHSL
jgi:hypothetical protein